MSRLKGWLVRARGLLWTRVVEHDLDAEIRHHLELETEANLRRGLSPSEARRQARIAFGGVERVKEEHRDGRGIRWLEELLADVRYAARALRRTPAISLAAIATLGVGIGANTAVFSVVNAVVLRRLPFSDPDRLVMVSEDNPEKGWRQETAAPANFLDWRERVRSFQDVAGYAGGGQTTLTGDGAPRLLSTATVTGNFFRVLGASPARGRLFDSTETWGSGTRTAVLSYRAWRREFGGADVHGRTVILSGAPTEIVGVAGPSFELPSEHVDVYLPTGWKPANRTEDWFRRAHWLRVIARLRRGVSLERADAELQVVVRQLQIEHPATNRVMGADLMPLQAFFIRDVRLPLLVLQGAVTLLLLIGCANVGNLLVVQAAERGRETALRLTLGAGRLRLVRQAIAESLTLALLGGGLGIALALGGTRLLTSRVPPGMLPIEGVAPDGRLLAYALAIAIGSGLLFGLAPMLRTRRQDAGEVLRDGGDRTTDGRQSRRITHILAIGEVALALWLAVGAGLLVRSFTRLLDVDPGFDPANVLTVTINLPERRYDTDAKAERFFDELVTRSRTIPGVTLAATALLPPLTKITWTGDFHVEGRPADDYGSEAMHESVSADYFRLLRIPIQAGRAFTRADRADAAPVVIINAALVRRYFRNENPIGRRITFAKVPDSTSVWRTIVGVVGDVRQASLALEPVIEIFAPAAQEPNSYATLLLRTEADPAGAEPAVRAIVRAMDPNLAISGVATMASLRSESVARERFLMLLLSIFAAAGLFLAIVGVYGVLAQLARRQIREMGIRMALGAEARQVQWLVLRQGMRLSIAGLIAGSVIALISTRGMRTLLFEIRPDDPGTYGSAIAILAGAACLASWIPARRASRADPARVLRTE